MKKIVGRVAAAMGIMVILFSPLLLIVDYKRYLSLVMLIWFTSVIYYLWIKRKERWNMVESADENKPDPGPVDQKGTGADVTGREEPKDVKGLSEEEPAQGQTSLPNPRKQTNIEIN